MSNYSQTTNFTSKDSLPSGTLAKRIRGSEFDVEFAAISSAVASKADITYVDTEVATKQDEITAGTTSQYYRGDKTFQTLNAAAISDSTTTGRSVLTAADAAAARTAISAGDVTTDTDQTITGSKRGAVTTDNDLSFDMNVGNNFSCTPTGTGTLTFTNITAGQSGFILLVNGSNYTISAAATTKISTTDLTRISASGTYLVSYFSNGTNVYCVASGSLV
jgi:hypothetical protein